MDNESNTRLHGRWLLLARLTWVIIATLSFSLFLLGLVPYATQLHTVCLTNTGACYLDGALSPAGVQALHDLGISIDGYIWYTVVVTLLVALTWATVGLVIFWHRSDDWMTLLVALFLVMFNLTLTGGPMASQARFSPGWTLPVTCLEFLAVVIEGCFFFLFPTGRFVPRWMRWIFVLFVVQQFASIFLPPNSPLNSMNWPAWLNDFFLLTVVGTVVFSQIYRYWRISTSTERQQTKWVLFGILMFLVGGLALSFVPSSSNLQSGLFNLANDSLDFIIFLPVPLSIGIAMLRYRLYDIDIIINRTLVYGLLTACIVGIYALVVGSLSSLLQVQGNFLISLLAAGLVAVVFHPLRTRLQRSVNRLLYGQRGEPYTVLSQLGRRLEATLAPERVLPTIVETTAQALKLPYVAITLKQEGEFVLAASHGTSNHDLTHVALIYQGEHVGEFLLAPRSPGEAFSPADHRLLQDLARQASVAVYAVGLTTDLQRLTADLQSSRTQLVTTREEERRRLRRDLHDGLGSVLASLNLRAGAIRAVLVRDRETAERLLEEQQTTIRSAIADIRRLVYDLRPPSLDELGLIGALRERVAHYNCPTGSLREQERIDGLYVTLEAPEGLPPLSAAIEVAVYRIVQEALANVARHAQAHTCCVRLTATEETLYVEVSDDGVGLPTEQHVGVGLLSMHERAIEPFCPAMSICSQGVGLLSMRERAVELGGTCQIKSMPEGGTRVSACLPLLPQ